MGNSQLNKALHSNRLSDTIKLSHKRHTEKR